MFSIPWRFLLKIPAVQLFGTTEPVTIAAPLSLYTFHFPPLIICALMWNPEPWHTFPTCTFMTTTCPDGQISNLRTGVCRPASHQQTFFVVGVMNRCYTLPLEIPSRCFFCLLVSPRVHHLICVYCCWTLPLTTSFWLPAALQKRLIVEKAGCVGVKSSNQLPSLNFHETLFLGG